MSAHPHTGVGILGLGFMGTTHRAAWQKAADDGLPVHLAATADGDPERGADHGDLEGLLSDPAVQIVSICTPTDTHVAAVHSALAAGRHVLVEKPVSLDPAEIDALAAAAAAADRICMPAMCMRFWPSWAWLHERILDGALGAVRSATFRRVSAPPGWSSDFYLDANRSGGAMVDLHVHDVDFVRWCFGEPTSVMSTGDPSHLLTAYTFADGPGTVSAEGGWLDDPDLDFRMSYRVEFDRAVCIADSAADDELVVERDGESETIQFPGLNGYEAEVRHLLACVRAKAAGEEFELTATLEDAAAHMRIIGAERRSLESGAPVGCPSG